MEMGGKARRDIARELEVSPRSVRRYLTDQSGVEFGRAGGRDGDSDLRSRTG